MAKGEYLGEFEQLVLLAMARLKGDAYGMSIRREIERHSDRDAAIGSVYSALTRLERKDYVSARVGDPTPERGGRAKRYYAIESAGREALKRSLKVVSNLIDGLELDLS